MKNHCSHASGAYKVTPPGNSFMLLVSSSSPQFCFKDAVNVLQAIARLVLLAGMPSICLMIAASRSPCCCQLRGFRWEANVQKPFLPFHGCGSHCESASSNWTEERTAGPKQAQCLSSLCLQGGLVSMPLTKSWYHVSSSWPRAKHSNQDHQALLRRERVMKRQFMAWALSTPISGKVKKCCFCLIDDWRLNFVHFSGWQ